MLAHQLFLVSQVLSFILVMFGGAFLLPISLSLLLGEPFVQDFLIAFFALLAASAVLWLIGKSGGGKPRELHGREAMLLVVLCWVVLPFFACLPFMFFSEHVDGQLGLARAYFEAVSGITTTGATTMTGLDSLPLSINFWRLFLQWLGGMGILVLAVAVIPMIGVGGGQLFRSESTGPLKDQKLTPRITETAKGLWLVYLLLTGLCALCYWCAGMSIFDAVLHSFSTLSLGGLSTHDASFGFFNSPAIEWVAIVFMTLASCNFALYFVALYRGSLATIFRDGEFRVTLIILLGFGTFCFIYLVLHGVVDGSMSGLRTVFFNVISIASTTGYSSTDYTQWPLIIPLLMILMSGASTSAGSTGAGLKIIRLMVLFQQIGRELRKSVHKRLVDPVRVSGSPIDNKTVFSILVFVCIYGLSVLLVSLLFVASGLAFDTSFSASLAMINNMGPGLNEIGPSGNYAGFTTFQLWISSVAMILGRIEFLSFLVLLSKSFWRA